MQKTVEQLPCKLSPEELLLKSKEHARIATDIGEREAKLKADNSASKSEIERLKDKARDLVREIDTGEEIRPIECIERPRYDDMLVDVVRADLGTIVRVRAMHPDERQLAVDLGDAPPPAPKGKSKRKAEAKQDPEATESAH